MHHPTDRITHTTAFVTPVVEHWLEREIAQWLRLYGVGHMVKDHSDSERGNLLPPYGLVFVINSKGSFICTNLQRIAYTMVFVTPVVEHRLEREIAQWAHHEESIRRSIAP